MASISKTIIILAKNNGIWFNDNLCIPIEATNLPVGEFKFVEGRQIFWSVELISFDKISAALSIRIINYRPAMVDEFLNQKPKADIQSLIFSEIFWPAFNADLSFYKKTSFLPLLVEKMPDLDTGGEIIVHLHAEIPFSKVRFGAGFIVFDYKFHWTAQKTEIKIYNTHIIPEFEYIKSYFSRHFNSRTFQVLMIVIKNNHQNIKVTATSSLIEQIKDVAIDTLKFVKMEKLKRPPKFLKEIDKSLFTSEDIFDPFVHDTIGTHPMTQKELFDQIMTWENIRNKAQLEYLCGYVHDVAEKIRFTLTPKFGFLFVANADRMKHYIWEMLNTNATYIWSFDKESWDKNKEIVKMEEVISFIRNHGRDAYLRNVSPHEEVLFRRVLHQGAGSQLVDHFPRWRHTINEAMV